MIHNSKLKAFSCHQLQLRRANPES